MLDVNIKNGGVKNSVQKTKESMVDNKIHISFHIQIHKLSNKIFVLQMEKQTQGEQ